MADIFDTVDQEEPKKDIFDQVAEELPPKPLSNVAAMKSGVAEMSPEARSAAEQVVQALPQVASGVQQGQMAVMTGGGSLMTEALTPHPVKEFMRSPTVPVEAVDVGRRALQYPLHTILFGEPPQEQGALGTVGRFASDELAAQTSPENLAVIAGTMGLGAAEGILAKRAPSLAETLFGRARPSVTPATEAVVEPTIAREPQPIVQKTNEALQQPERTANAGEITSTTSTTQPEVRTPVGEGAPLRQQGEASEARQGTETQPQTQEVAPTVPRPEQPASQILEPSTATTAEPLPKEAAPVETVPPVTPPTETPPVQAAEAPQPEAKPGTQSVIAGEREARGIDPYERELRQSWGSAVEEANAKSAANPEHGEQLAHEISQTSRVATPDEHVSLLKNWRDKESAYDRAIKSGNPEAVSAAKAEVEEAYDALDKAGTSWGRAGVARQMILDEFYTPTRMRAEMKAAGNGKLSPADEARINTIHKEFEASKANVNDREGQLRADKGMSEKLSERIKRHNADIDAAAEEARQSILKERGSLKWDENPNPCVLV